MFCPWRRNSPEMCHFSKISIYMCLRLIRPISSKHADYNIKPHPHSDPSLIFLLSYAGSLEKYSFRLWKSDILVAKWEEMMRGLRCCVLNTDAQIYRCVTYIKQYFSKEQEEKKHKPTNLQLILIYSNIKLLFYWWNCIYHLLISHNILLVIRTSFVSV